MARDRDDDRYDGEDDRPRRRPRRDEDRDDDRPRGRDRRDDARPQSKQTSVLGVLALIGGIPSVAVTFIPCCGWMFGIPAGVVTLTLGIIGLVLAKGSQGRVGTGLPLAGTILGGAAVVISVAWVLFFTVLAATAPTVPSSSSTGNAVSPSDPVTVSLTPLELTKQYTDNKTVADALYQGKVVEVTGKVKSVSDTGEDSDLRVKLDGFNFVDVDCQFNSGQRSSVSNLSVGSTVTIRGRCAGTVVFDVVLNDCIVMPDGPNRPAGGGNKGPDAGAVKVTAGVLAKAFKDNAAAADAKYGDKSVEVSGPVFATDLTDPDNQIVFLGQKGKDVECRFGKESLKGQAAITTGKQVTVRGKCQGNDDSPVVLEDCKLVK